MLNIFFHVPLDHLLYLWRNVYLDLLPILKNILKILFLAALGLCCYIQAFSSCGKQGLLSSCVCSLLIAMASPVGEHGL